MADAKVFHVSIRSRRVDFTGAGNVRGEADSSKAEQQLREALADEDLVRIEPQGEDALDPVHVDGDAT